MITNLNNNNYIFYIQNIWADQHLDRAHDPSFGPYNRADLLTVVHRASEHSVHYIDELQINYYYYCYC